MTSVKESLKINRRISITVVIMVTALAVFMFKFAFNQKSENRALRIKILSMQENRKTPKPWTNLLTPVKQPNLIASVIAPKVATPSAVDVVSGDDQVIEVQDTLELAEKLNNRMKRVKNLEALDIDNNIAIANEIISREPDSYSAYKAKLISLLTKEGKFNQPVDEVEIESTLESMAQFNTSSDNLSRREAALISNTNGEIQNVENQLAEVARQKEMLETQFNSYAPDSPEFAELNLKIQQLDEKEIQLASHVESLEINLINNTAQLANEDVVEIPFMRMLAKNDLEGVIDNAAAFIEEFPNSPNGYFYMIKALEMQGQKDQALQIIQDSRLPQDAQQALLQRLEGQSLDDPKNYWQKLIF